MSMNPGAGSDTAELMAHTEVIRLGNHSQQTDADGRIFYSSEFVSSTANNNCSWRWTLLRSGDELFNFCVESLSDRSVTLSSVVYGRIDSSGNWVVLTEKQNIGQPSFQSGDFSVDANSWPLLDEAFRRNNGCWIRLRINLEWTEEVVNATSIPLSSDCMLEGLFGKVRDGGDTVYELVSSDGQSFFAIITILKAKSAYFQRFFTTQGWKEQTDGRMTLAWTSAIIEHLLRYIYLNKIDGDICQHLPDILDAAQMWELIGMKQLIEGQMKERLQKAARDADTDTAAEYLKMADLHQLTSLVSICNGILAANFDKFYDSDICKQIEQNETSRNLIKGIVRHKRN